MARARLLRYNSLTFSQGDQAMRAGTPGLFVVIAFLGMAGCASEPPAPPPPPPEPAPVAQPEPEPAPAPEPAPPPAEPTPPPGEWSTSALSVRTQAKAERQAEALRGQGYTVEIRQVELQDGTWFRLVIPGLATRDDAKALATQLESIGYKGAWVPALGQ